MATQKILLPDQATEISMGGRYYLPFGVYTHLSPMSVTASNPYAQSIDRNFTCRNFTQAYVVLTTNDGSNYWQIKLKVANNSSGADLVSITTATGSPNVWQTVGTSTFTISSVTTTYYVIYLECNKVGAPGNLYLAGPTLEIDV